MDSYLKVTKAYSDEEKMMHSWIEWIVLADLPIYVVENEFYRKNSKLAATSYKTVTKYIRNMRQMASEFHRGIENMADEADLKDSFNELKNNNIDKTIQSHLDPDNEVTKALQQAKDSADLANETNKVKETLKTTAEDSLKDENNLESQPNKNIEISKSEDNMSSTKL